MSFVPFRHISNGAIAYYPEHYADDPHLSADLERYYEDSDLWEEDKVVDESHVLPVEQRARTVAKPLDEMTKSELKDAAKSVELPVSGNKDALIERLKNDKDNK